MFSRVGGDTVILSGLSAALMEQLLQQPQTLDSLVEAIRNYGASVVVPDSFPDEILNLLDHLVRIEAAMTLPANHGSAVAAEGSPTR